MFYFTGGAMKKRLIAIILLITFILPSFYSCSQRKKQTAERFDCFDTYSLLTVYCEESEFEPYKQEFDTILVKYHELFDIYNSYEEKTNLKTLNDSASLAPTIVSKELFDAIKYAKELYTLTNRKCNVALGAITSLWHDARSKANAAPESAELPQPERITEALLHIDISNLVLNESECSVYYSDNSLSLDFGAIAKGYVASLLYEKLISVGCDSFLINLGGNIVSHGEKPDGDNWLTKIENPFENKSLGYNEIIELHDETLVTSGSYQRYFKYNGKSYSHIIDTENGYPAESFTSVSVKASSKDSALADALSTALFCMPYEDGLSLVSSLNGFSALWIFNDGSVRCSKDFGGAK